MNVNVVIYVNIYQIMKNGWMIHAVTWLKVNMHIVKVYQIILIKIVISNFKILSITKIIW